MTIVPGLTVGKIESACPPSAKGGTPFSAIGGKKDSTSNDL